MKDIFLIFLIGILISACSSSKNPGGYFEDDGPHKNVSVDVSNIPDAIPRRESIDPTRSRPYIVLGKKYFPMTEARNYRELGVASWYGRKFHGRKTALGERYDMYAMTAAHKTLPLPSYVRVRNLKNNRAVVVRVNDRGPFLHNRLIDLSYAAAHRLNMLGAGTADVEVIVITPGDTPIPATAATGTPARTSTTAASTNPIAKTTPLKAQELTTEELTATAGGSIYIQVGAFGSAKNAESLRSRLEQAEFRPVLVLPFKSGDSQLFRVRIGPLENAGAGDTVSRRLADMGLSNTQIINE